MGRKARLVRREQFKTIMNIYVPIRVRERVIEEARKTSRTVSDIVTEAICEYLKVKIEA